MRHCATLQPWQSTLEEEAARTAIHVGDLRGVPRRDIPVEARGAVEHYGKATNGLTTAASATQFAEWLCEKARAAVVAWHCGGGGGTHCDSCW